jgi:cell division transport system ATP-binding protein
MKIRLMLNFNHVFKRYATNDALIDVSFHLDKGEIAFLTGNSGAGKSTVLKLIAIMERCSKGQMLFDGQNLCRVREEDIPILRRKLGLIFQDYKLLANHTVFHNVALPLLVSGVGHYEVARRVSAALDKVGLLGKEKKYPSALSGGEQQRVGIARAVVNKPALILADEPTGNLDPKLSVEIMYLFEEFQRVGVSVLIATHETGIVAETKHKVLKLDDGRLVSSS